MYTSQLRQFYWLVDRHLRPTYATVSLSQIRRAICGKQFIDHECLLYEILIRFILNSIETEAFAAHDPIRRCTGLMTIFSFWQSPQIHAMKGAGNGFRVTVRIDLAG